MLGIKIISQKKYDSFISTIEQYDMAVELSAQYANELLKLSEENKQLKDSIANLRSTNGIRKDVPAYTSRTEKPGSAEYPDEQMSASSYHKARRRSTPRARHPAVHNNPPEYTRPVVSYRTKACCPRCTQTAVHVPS